MSTRGMHHPKGVDTHATTIERPGNELIEHVYHELRRLAAFKLHRMSGHEQTVQATALVHEAYLRLSKRGERRWKGRRHFYHAAALAMRYILIERARSRHAARQHGWQQTDISLSMVGHEDGHVLSREDVIALEQVLSKLEQEHPEVVEIVLLRYFCGLTIAEIAKMREVSARTVERDWTFARAWLLNHMRS